MNKGSEQAMATRSASAAQGIKWNLDEVLPARSGKLFSNFIEQLESTLVEFESSRSSLSNNISSDQFLLILKNYEQIIKMIARLGSYSYMYFSEDTRLQDARTFKARAEEINTDASNRVLFFELWWKNLERETSKRLIKFSSSYAYFLERMLKAKPFTLKEEVEQAINLKDSTGRSALLLLYHQIRDSFVYEIKIRDEARKLTEERLRDLFYSASREERKAAYESQLTKFQQNTDVLGEIYKALSRDWRNECIKLRKYSTPIAVRNLSNDVPDEAVETLLEVCRSNAIVFQDFFRVKAKILGLSDFARYDIYAPYPKSEERQYTWEEGVKLVLDTFSTFNGDFAAMARNVIASNHIDAEPREGKLGGAYCMGITPEIVPYVLTSYTGKTRSISTLAHELGHAIHGQLAARNTKNQLTFEATLPMAETASVFGEMILTDRLMEESDEAAKRSLLLEMIDEAYATIARQAFFVLFEKEAHEKIASGVNVDDLSSLYLENLRTQFGSAVQVPDYFRYEWNVIPHIYQSPFYCYAYSWGNLLVLALYKQFRSEGAKTFAPKYMKILSAGSSSSPESILSKAGFDIRSRTFWQGGFDEISRSVTELQKIT